VLAILATGESTPNWTDITTAIGSGLTALVVVIALLIAIWQVFEARRRGPRREAAAAALSDLIYRRGLERASEAVNRWASG
jgi:hypothetical protein